MISTDCPLLIRENGRVNQRSWAYGSEELCVPIRENGRVSGHSIQRSWAYPLGIVEDAGMFAEVAD